MQQQKYCPFCGVELFLPTQYALPVPQCPACSYVGFNSPRPVVLTLVYDGERILLGRSARCAPGIFALLAGHVEPGETAEQAALREVKEESHLGCKLTHYMGSFPTQNGKQLCLTYAAEYQGGEPIADDDVEEVRWFRLSEELPVQGAIAREVIQRFKNGKGCKLT